MSRPFRRTLMLGLVPALALAAGGATAAPVGRAGSTQVTNRPVVVMVSGGTTQAPFTTPTAACRQGKPPASTPIRRP